MQQNKFGKSLLMWLRINAFKTFVALTHYGLVTPYGVNIVYLNQCYLQIIGIPLCAV